MGDGFLFKSFQYSITFEIILNPSQSSYNIAAFAQQTQRYHTVNWKLIQAREKKRFKFVEQTVSSFSWKRVGTRTTIT
jgi:hypothetical protein